MLDPGRARAVAQHDFEGYVGGRRAQAGQDAALAAVGVGEDGRVGAGALVDAAAQQDGPALRAFAGAAVVGHRQPGREAGLEHALAGRAGNGRAVLQRDGESRQGGQPAAADTVCGDSGAASM